MAEKEGNVIFGGRLGQYKYYDMDQVIEAALALVGGEAKQCKEKIGENAQKENNSYCNLTAFSCGFNRRRQYDTV